MPGYPVKPKGQKVPRTEEEGRQRREELIAELKAIKDGTARPT